MKVTAERLPASQVRLEIASDQAEFDQAIEKATRRVASQVTVPGFRRGKAPRGLVVRHIGRPAIVNEANGDLMDDLYRRAIEQEDLIPVTRPEVEVLTDEPLTFRVAVEIAPAVEVEGYEAVRVEPEHYALTDADVDEYIDNLREERSPWAEPPTARPVQEGDQVVVDIAAFEGDQPFDEPTTGATFTLGKDNLLPQIRDLILGATVGEPVERIVTFPDANPEAEATRDVDADGDVETSTDTDAEGTPPVIAEGEGTTETGIDDSESLDAPDADTAVTNDMDDSDDSDDAEGPRPIPEQLLGKTLDYRVTVQSIKERQPLPLDDDLATALGSPRPQTLSELRADIYRQLRRQRETQARVATINRIMDEMRGIAKVEIGPAVLQQQTEEDAARQFQQFGGMGIDVREIFGRDSEALQNFLDRIRPESELRLTNSLIAREIADREQIEVTPDDIHEEVHRLGMDHSVLEDERTVELIEADLRERAIFDRIITLATDGQGLIDDSPESAYAAAVPEAAAHDHDGDDDHDHSDHAASGDGHANDDADAVPDGDAESLDQAQAEAEDPATEIAYRSGEHPTVADGDDAGTISSTSDATPAPASDAVAATEKPAT